LKSSPRRRHGLKLAEIKELMRAVDGAGQAMKGWLEVANTCDCGTPAECRLFAAPGEAYDAARALRIVHVEGDCRRT